MKRAFSIIVKFALAALLTLVCFEVYFRTTEISLPSLVRDDPVLGRTFRPNAPVALLQEGFYMGRVNDFGYLGPSYPREKTSGTFRVVMNGDSYVEAFQLFPKYNVRSVLEADLSELVEPDVEVLNFGRSGQDLRTTYTYYKDLAAAYKPDVALFILTDHSFRSRDDAIGPKCYLDDDGELQVNYDFAESDAYRRKIRLGFTRRFGSYQILQNALYRYRNGETVKILFDKFVPRKRVAEARTRVSDGKDKYFELNSAVLEELGRINRAGETRVIIVGHKRVPDYYLSVIEDAGLEYIDLNPELDRLESTGVNPYYWPVTNSLGHWNHDGSRFIGNYLAGQLQGLVEE
jgi:hypothetical protein